ncbi:aspartyl/asparaginyl beta-hydroxylase domain-containing protein [Arenimonas sp.]|uniref:aspartyl/asparaginyl beta-hydroxylase domain-containing protein n=1 Tax=Arenimonas sp. TaxID=1872635 RepID=UPI0025E07401|nr:aspartyl/asparaginyl beta-hydroxylase domain-containing protein [Arenimonas sp.]
MTHTPQIQAMAAEAERLAQSGQAEHAARRYREVLAAAPDHGPAAHFLAMQSFWAGRLEDARRLIEQACAGQPRAAVFEANRGRIFAALGNAGGTIEAYEAALALDPGFLPVRLDLAQVLESAGRVREATQHYRAALDQAARIPTLPVTLQQQLAHGSELVRAEQRQLEDALRQAMAQAPAGTAAGARFEECFEILMGRAKPQLPKPGFMYFPKLPALTFYPRELFPWAAALEARTDEITAEVTALMAGGEKGFIPYVQKPEGEVPDSEAWRAINHNPDWGVFFLHNQGERVARNCEACPVTAAALDEVPLVHIRERGPTAFFSRLRPGTHIPPHHGATNTRTIVHLPLIIPPDCAIRVGNDTRQWQRGEILAFDDTIEHEAWNRSQEARVVLILDVWNPFLDERERAMVAAVTEAYAAFYPERQHILD